MRMEIDAGAASGQISPFRIARVSQSGGRVSVPVKPSQTVFAQFRYISGTPASVGEGTVPISKLRLLNRIVGMLQASKANSAGNPEFTDLQLDKTEIEEYGAKPSKIRAGLVLNLSA